MKPIAPEDLQDVAAELRNAWQNCGIPLRQYCDVTRGELENLRAGKSLPVFDVLLRALNRVAGRRPLVLDVGASSGFYSEVLQLFGFDCLYEAVDFSEDYKRLASILYPNVPFHVADAAKLPFQDSSFDFVLSSGVIIHALNYREVIREAVRVSSGHVIMARTPVTLEGPTAYFTKKAYDVQVLECIYEESDLMEAFTAAGLEIVSAEDVCIDRPANFRHVTYLLRKS